MNMRKIIIISLVSLMVLGCISTVSAGFFDFLKPETEISINDSANGSVYIDLLSSNQSVANKTVTIDVTSENVTKNYTVTTGSKQVLACNLIPGEYNVTAKFAGDDQYQASEINKTIRITLFSQDAIEDAVQDVVENVTNETAK